MDFLKTPDDLEGWNF